MNIAPQRPPVFRNSFPVSTAVVRASSCSQGTLSVTPPSGQSFEVPGRVSCCWNGWNCHPCHDNSEYVAWANSYFPACSGPQGCYVDQSCNHF
jgi:hypothetical protein